MINLKVRMRIAEIVKERKNDTNGANIQKVMLEKIKRM